VTGEVARRFLVTRMSANPVAAVLVVVAARLVVERGLVVARASWPGSGV